MTDTNQNLPQDISRFTTFHPNGDIPEVMAQNPVEVEPRPSLQMAMEGLHTSSWLQPQKKPRKRKGGNQHIPG